MPVLIHKVICGGICHVQRFVARVIVRFVDIDGSLNLRFILIIWSEFSRNIKKFINRNSVVYTNITGIYLNDTLYSGCYSYQHQNV